jgi:acyl-CoA synthetase (NDP forming)
MNDISDLLEPRSVAVIGASSKPEKSGHVLLKSIIVNNYQGKIYPINPSADEIMGHKAYPSILDVPGDIDLVFFLLPGKYIADLFEHCKQKRVKAAVIVAAGFSETGEEGAEAEAKLRLLVEESGIRCIGPNTIGFINMQAHLVASFVLFTNWQDGPIALAAQSGIFGGAVADELMDRTVQRIGICKSVAFGNKIDLDETDFIEYAWKDSSTEVIALHLEGLKRLRPFLSLANKVKVDKPIIVLKPGRTDLGARASASHTGSLAVDDDLLDHAFRQYGLIRADDLSEFLDYMKAFSYQPLPTGNRVGVVTFSGANGVMASDELRQHGFELATFTDSTLKRIQEFLPPWQPPTHPLDLWATLGAGNRLVHEEGILSVLNDENTDAVLVILLALANSDFDGMRDIYQAVRQQQPHKPVFTVILGGQVKQKWLGDIDGLNMPAFESTRRAIKSLQAMYWYSQIREQLQPDSLLSEATV